MLEATSGHGPLAEIEWLAGLFPVVGPMGGRLTLMFTDIEGFTTYAAAHGDRAAVQLVRHHDAAVLPAMRHHGGRILKRLGDGLMVAFGRPADAVAAALAIQHAAARARRLRLRIGIHVGRARARDGDLIGHDVNLAARIADIARGGQIVASRAVRAGAAGVPARFRTTRPLRITGREAVALFIVEEDS
jgi:adenylate cyclase